MTTSRSTSAASAKSTTTARPPRTKPQPTLAQAAVAADAANAALVDATERELAAKKKAEATAKRAERAAQVAARSAAKAADTANTEATNLQLLLEGTPEPVPVPAPPAPAPEPEPAPAPKPVPVPVPVPAPPAPAPSAWTKFVVFVKDFGLVAWLLAIIGGLLGIVLMMVWPFKLSGFNLVWYFMVPLLTFFVAGAIGWRITHRNTVVATVVVPTT